MADAFRTGRHAQDGAKNRADAGSPTEGEGQSDEERTNQAGAFLVLVKALLVVQKGELEDAHRVQTEYHDDDAGQEAHVAVHEARDARSGRQHELPSA